MALVCFGGTNRHCGSALWLPETYHPQAMALVCFGGTAQHRGSSSRLSIAAAVEMRKATVYTQWPSVAHSTRQSALVYLDFWFLSSELALAGRMPF